MRRREERGSELVDVISRKLVPFILLFGCYVISHGHISPGGGFQGGMVLASGVMLLAFSRGVETALRSFPLGRLVLAESLAFLLVLAAGIAGLALGRGFLGNVLPLGRAGAVPSAGFIFLLNLFIGSKVGIGASLIILRLLRED